jgi:hypothetical protein
MSVYTTLVRVAQIMKINIRTAIVMNRNAGIIRKSRDQDSRIIGSTYRRYS